MPKGDFIKYVVSNNPNKYPIDGEQGNYYYEKLDIELLESMTLPELPEATVVESQSANANTTAKSPLLKSINPQNSGK